MAAPVKRWFFSRGSQFFFKYRCGKPSQTSTTKYLINIGHCEPGLYVGICRRLLNWPVRAFLSLDPSHNFSLTANYIIEKNLNRQFYQEKSIVNYAKKFSTNSSDDSQGQEPPPNSKKPLKLMDFKEIIWPHPIKTLRNLWFSILIRGYFDNTYSPEVFLKGAEQAVSTVSGLVSEGRFDDLENLVSRDAIREVRKYYHDLTPKQRSFIKVDPRDLFFRFIYEIGMIFDDNTNQRFVEITAVFQGIHGMNALQQQNPSDFSEHMKKSQDQVYVCNYRFIREFTKGVEDAWTINKLNHFSPKELVSNTSIFQR